MNNYNQKFKTVYEAQEGWSYSDQLRRYMVKVFSHMFVALMITGLVSFSVIGSDVIKHFFSYSGDRLSLLGWIVMFMPLVFVFVFSSQLHRISSGAALMLLWFYAAIMGFSLAPSLYSYTGISIARVFFVAASTFLAMSIYGYTTRRNLASWGAFLLMGIIGILIASLVNIFFQSNALYFAISVITVLVFVGFTAYDVQRLKAIFDSPGYFDKEKVAVVGALALYMDFINLFMALLHLLGDRRRR